MYNSIKKYSFRLCKVSSALFCSFKVKVGSGDSDGSATHLNVLIDPGYLIEDPEYIAKSLQIWIFLRISHNFMALLFRFLKYQSSATSKSDDELAQNKMSDKSGPEN